MPTLKQTMEMLDKLAEERDRQEALRVSLAWQQEKAIPAEVRAKLDDLDAIFDPQLANNVVAIADLQQAIEKVVLEQGESVKGARLMAVYSRGRKQGEPSVAIRQVAKGE